MTAKAKLERIVELQNEIESISEDLKANHDVDVLQVILDQRGKKHIQIFTEAAMTEIFGYYDVAEFSGKSLKCSVEIEGVEIFALQPKLMKGEIA